MVMIRVSSDPRGMWQSSRVMGMAAPMLALGAAAAFEDVRHRSCPSRPQTHGEGPVRQLSRNPPEAVHELRSAPRGGRADFSGVRADRGIMASLPVPPHRSPETTMIL